MRRHQVWVLVLAGSVFLAASALAEPATPAPTVEITMAEDAGVASALGICVGSIFHTCAAALGLSAILARQ